VWRQIHYDVCTVNTLMSGVKVSTCISISIAVRPIGLRPMQVILYFSAVKTSSLFSISVSWYNSLKRSMLLIFSVGCVVLFRFLVFLFFYFISGCTSLFKICLPCIRYFRTFYYSFNYYNPVFAEQILPKSR
jgi:hypothetical protein